MRLAYWERLPLREQLMLAVNALLLLVVILFLTLGHGLRLRDARLEKQVALTEEAKTIYESVDAIANRGDESIQKLIDDVCARMNTTESPGHHIAVDWQGISLQARSHGRSSHDMFRSMREATNHDSQSSSDSNSLVVAKFDGPLGTIYVSEAEESVLRNARQELLRQIIAVLFAGALAGLMVQHVLHRVVTRPLRRLVITLGLIGDGDLNAKADERSCQELIYLSERINTMTRKLAEAERDRRFHMKKARDIQQRLRPTNGAVNGIETAELFEPADDVGGDYYDVIPLGINQCLLCLADVSGHGVPAAMAATVIKALVLEAIEVTNSPAEILHRINRRYEEIIMEGHFATMVIILVDRPQMTLTFANAGHELPFIRQPGQPVQRLEASGLLLGVDAEMTLTENSVTVADGTTIVLVSDGVTEMFDPEDNQFGTQRVSQVMENSSATDTQQLVNEFSEAFAKHRQTRAPFDDTTLLVARLSGA